MGKDFCAFANGVSDSPEAYAVKFMNEINPNLDEILLTKFRNLSPENQQKVLDFVDFLIWLDQKRNSKLSDTLGNSEFGNDY